jgi:iron-sulfur cluster repair di-iron protein
MNAVKVLRWSVGCTAMLAAALLVPGVALAHCDGMDGPVVKAAQKALADGNVNRVLIWIPSKDEGVIKAVFQKTLAVRKLSVEAQEVADMHFFETLVRIHRAGEGASYTGVKPAGRDLGPVIPAADKAIEAGSADALLKLLPEPGRAHARELFQAVLAKKDFKVDDVGAGRQYVAAYVTVMHAVERLHGGGDCDACEHTNQGRHAAEDLAVSQRLLQGKIHLDGTTTVRDLVGRYPQTRPVFEQHGIDYCCGGGQSLAEVAQKHRLELPALMAAVEKALHAPPDKSAAVNKDWYAVPLQELINHIVGVHHAYLKKELPRLGMLEQKVLRAHGARHGDMLRQVHTLFVGLDGELSRHLAREEREVFPEIVAAQARALEKTSDRTAASKSVRDPVGQLEQEHANAGTTLARLREVTNNYTLPSDACPTFKALYDELQQMEADLHQHIHLENNVLFPRALKLDH